MAVTLGQWDQRPIAISVKPNCLTISIDGPVDADVFSYDMAGRMWTAYLDQISYRRGLDGKMIAKWRLEGQQRDRRWLPQAEALEIEEQARQQVEGLTKAIGSGQAVLNTPLPQKAAFLFERVIAFDRDRSMRDAEQYFEVYKPVGILPPDQYMAVVLQATEGCSFNACTFCNFYRDRRFRIKNAEDFREHARAVKAFLGEGISLRRTIFLGDANALVVPMKRLVPLFDVVNQSFDVEALGGIYAFLDGFSGEKKSAEDYAELHKRGLTRVYIGMESGSKRLLEFLNKPGGPDEAIQAVRAMKAAGVAVGIIVLLGAGGHEHSREHIKETARVINTMGLDLDDIVYFSELLISEGMQYAQDAFAANLRPMTHEERIGQQEAIEKRLRFSRSGGTPHISRYDIREFVY
jgi:hypothetical protein